MTEGSDSLGALRAQIAVRLEECELLIASGQSHDTVPNLIEAVELAETAFPDDETAQLPSFILLGHAYLEAGRLKEAEKNLTQALWNIVKLPDVRPAERARLHGALGRLYTQKNMPAEALTHLAEQVYHTTVAFGPKNPRVALAYSDMAILFDHDDAARAAALRQHAIALWSTFFQNILLHEDDITLNDALMVLGRKMLISFQGLMEQGGVANDDKAALSFCLAAMAMLSGDVSATRAWVETGAPLLEGSTQTELKECFQRLASGLQ